MFLKQFFNVVVRPALGFVLVVSLLLAGGRPGAGAEGNVIYVTEGGSSSLGCGDSWETACSLQYALQSVAAAGSGDQIWVAAGTYRPGAPGSREATFQLISGVAVYGGFAGIEGEEFSDRDWSTNRVILSGDLNQDDDGFTNNGENSYQVVTGATGATLDGVNITAGNADGFDIWPYYSGGGILNFSSSPTLTNITLSGNAALFGGGMVNVYHSSAVLTNVTIVGNQAKHGGGMFNDGSSPTLTNVTISGNTALEGGGMINNGGEPILIDVTISNNSADEVAGGMYNLYSSPILTGVTIRDNTANWWGGGMYNEYSSPNLSNVILSGNTALEGGRMANFTSSPVLTSVAIIGNTASTFGGGIISGYSSSPVLTNVTISGNTAVDTGGGMYNNESSPILTNVTISGNSAGIIGGGLANLYGSSPSVHNSILWDNDGDFICAVYNDSDSSAEVSYSIVQGGYAGTANLDADPLLAPLGSYGSSLQSMALLPGSAAIAAGDGDCPATDQRGLPRSPAGCDLGAFESQGFQLANLGGDNQSTPLLSAFPQPLTVSVTANHPDEPVAGGQVSFTSPASGASASLSASLAVIAGGTAQVNAQANASTGSYLVTATTTGSASGVDFRLSNYDSSIPSIYNTYIPILLR